MKTGADILVENLKEALKTCHQYILWATWMSLFLFALLFRKGFTEAKASSGLEPVEVFGIRTDGTLAEIFAIIAITTFGLMAYLSVSRIQRIKYMLASEPAMLKAALTFPSIPTIHSTGGRMLALLMPCLLFIASLSIIFIPKLFDDDPNYHPVGVIFIILLLNAPYIILAITLRDSLISLRYLITAKDLVTLRPEITEDSFNKLKDIAEKEHPNKTEFIRALQNAKIKNERDRVKIIKHACEHPFFED